MATGSITLRLQGNGTGHRFGVNAIETWRDYVYSAGRDGTVRSWRLDGDGEASAALQHTLEEHTQWVNGVVMVQPHVLATCSSDRSVKVWSLPKSSDDSGSCETLGVHADYAKAIAFAPQRGLLTSAGFDCRLLLWDPGRASPVAASIAPAMSEEGAIHRDSIYALACNEEGTLLATGSVDRDVRLWDPRDLRSSIQLNGHTDIVRSVSLCADGVHAVSCSSDGSVRLWHLGERRCVQVLAQHSSSVFSICTRGSHVFSGDADGQVLLSSTSANAPASLLCKSSASVLSLSVDAKSSRLWIATSSSTMHAWDLRQCRELNEPPHPPTTSSSKTPRLVEPCATIPGCPGIRRHAALPSKLQVLTESDDGELALWDLPTARCVRKQPSSAAGKAHGGSPSAFDEALRAYETQLLSVPTWFSLSSRSGLLEVSLDASTCFNAEAYVSDLGRGGLGTPAAAADEEDGNADVRVNLGERMIAALLGRWRRHLMQVADEADASAPGTFPLSDPSALALTVMDEGAVILKCSLSELSSTPPENVPAWMLACALNGRFEPPRDLKLAFTLEPHVSAGSPTKLRELLSAESRLTAPRSLKLRKVVAYIEEKLGDAAPEASLELRCADKLLSLELSLSAVRAFYWKQGGDMVLTYAERQPADAE